MNMKQVKRNRGAWLTDIVYNHLKAKAAEKFPDQKGAFEKYLELIAMNKVIIIQIDSELPFNIDDYEMVLKPKDNNELK